MMINERLQKFLKEAKIKLMLGGVLGAVTLGGSAATISYAQDNVTTEVEYNDDVTIDPTLSNNTVEYDYEYSEQLKDYFDGKLTLRDATHTGGATRFLYDGIARGISLETGLDFEEVRDTMINLNLDIISVDPMQLDILYPEGVNYTRLHENTDQILYKTITDSPVELSKFAGSDVDFEVISELDQIYLKHCNILSVTSYDSQQLIKCFNFCFGRDEINGHKFEDLGSCGKRLALVYYQRMKNLMSKTYNVCIENDVSMSDEYIKVYQAIEPVTMLSVAKNVGSDDLIKHYYYLNLDSLKEEQTKEEKQSSSNYYNVKPGDALWKIALEHGMTAQELYDLNRDVIGDNPNLIKPGQKLRTNPMNNIESKTK